MLLFLALHSGRVAFGTRFPEITDKGPSVICESGPELRKPPRILGY